MRIPFIKMHGLGNDFVVIDRRTADLPAMDEQVAARLADRHTGIGCDQLIVLEPSKFADFRMQIFNADGSEVGACGNASRAVALLHGRPARVETDGGEIALRPVVGGAQVDMGRPRFAWQDIPLAFAMDSAALPLSWGPLERGMAVNVGNPHVVFFVPDADAIALDELGPVVEHDPAFPERVNVNVATVTPHGIRLRVWERGAGLTLACGTGACATAVAAIRQKLVTSPVTVSLPGGELRIAWDGADGSILMTGPATESFRGTFEWDAFA